MAIFRMTSGAMASVHSSLTQWKNVFSFEVFGEDGYLRVEGLGASYGTEKLIAARRDFSAPFQDTITEFRGGDISWREEWKEFTRADRGAARADRKRAGRLGRDAHRPGGLSVRAGRKLRGDHVNAESPHEVPCNRSRRVHRQLSRGVPREGRTRGNRPGPCANPGPRQLSSQTFTFVEADLLDRKSIACLIDSVRPEVVFHLAAQSYPSVSWKQPAQTFEVNVLGTIFLFEEILARKLDPTIVVVCSSSEYAPSRDGQPITEQDELVPSSPYAVSKLAQDHLGRLYHEFHGLKVVRCRPFFLIGPRKTGDVCVGLCTGYRGDRAGTSGGSTGREPRRRA